MIRCVSFAVPLGERLRLPEVGGPQAGRERDGGSSYFFHRERPSISGIRVHYLCFHKMRLFAAIDVPAPLQERLVRSDRSPAPSRKTQLEHRRSFAYHDQIYRRMAGGSPRRDETNHRQRGLSGAIEIAIQVNGLGWFPQCCASARLLGGRRGGRGSESAGAFDRTGRRADRRSRVEERGYSAAPDARPHSGTGAAGTADARDRDARYHRVRRRSSPPVPTPILSSGRTLL